MLNLHGLEVEEKPGEFPDRYEIPAFCHWQPSPCCASGWTSNGTKTVRYRDCPMHGKRVLIVIKRQRYKCRECGRTEYQTIPHMAESSMMTKRLVEYLEKESLNRTFAALSKEVGVNESTIRAIFRRYATREMAKLNIATPEWLGLDELYVLSKFRGIVTNIKDKTIVDILPTRRKEAIISFLSKLPRRQDVKLVAMDMWNPYREAVKLVLPDAKIIVDKFHVVRMANEAMERIRKEHRVSLPFKQRLQLKDDRWILLRNDEDMEAHERMIVETWFEKFPLIKKGHEAKEGFRRVWKAQSVAEAMELYDKWQEDQPDDIEPAFLDLRRAMLNWRTEIFNYFEFRVTNAYTESLNNIARMMNRLGRGYSFEVFRAKLLLGAHAKRADEPYRISGHGGGSWELPPLYYGVPLSTLEGGAVLVPD